MTCDWSPRGDGPNGHCAGEVLSLDHEHDRYQACKRHHNLFLRRWYPEIPKR